MIPILWLSLFVHRHRFFCVFVFPKLELRITQSESRSNIKRRPPTFHPTTLPYGTRGTQLGVGSYFAAKWDHSSVSYTKIPKSRVCTIFPFCQRVQSRMMARLKCVRFYAWHLLMRQYECARVFMSFDMWRILMGDVCVCFANSSRIQLHFL